MYAHAGAQHMAQGTVLHSRHPAVDNNILMCIHLCSSIQT